VFKILATKDFPAMAQLTVGSTLVWLRYQFENADLNGEAYKVERGVREREENTVWDSDGS
jgi:hypothetical protein